MHITVGVSSRGPQEKNLERELRLAKTAILFGDNVSLYSLNVTFAITNLALSEWTTNHMLEYCESVLPTLFTQKDELDKALAECKEFERINNKRGRTEKEQKSWLRSKGMLSKLTRELKDTALEMQRGGIAELTTAQKAGLLQVRPFESLNPDKMVTEFFSTMQTVVSSKDTIPLLDQYTNELCLEILEDHRSSSIDRARLTPINLVNNIFEFISACERLPMDEVISIRQTLQNPLIRFRAAMLTYGKQMEELPWSDSFATEARLIYDQYIAPSLLEVKTLVEEDTSLRALLGTGNLKSGPLALFSLGVSGAAFIPLAGVACVGGAAAWQALINLKEHEKHQTEMESHALYYAYRIKEAAEG